MDIWEANKISEAYTAHPCSLDGPTRCEGKDCGDGAAGRTEGVCDKDGCDLNPYRVNVKDFFGPGTNFKIDTTKKFTVVTQFHTDDKTANGTLSEIRRVFVQDGIVHEHPMSNTGEGKQYDSISDEMCDAFKGVFGDTNTFKKHGGLAQMGKAMAGDGMVLVMSIWDDHEANMLWLDSTDPPTKTTIGGPRGTCPTTGGKPADVEKNHPDAHVIFSDIKVGDIGSTYNGGPAPTPPGPTPTTCDGCGYGCDNNCHCNVCNVHPGCMSKDTCMTNCNSGGNAHWCGGTKPPTPPTPPTPSQCPGGSLSACIALCPNTHP
jgi:cellulose 1,4-beta-cellobiosidase